MKKAVQKIVNNLVRRLGGQVEAVYLFGSLAQGFYQPEESDINLLAVVQDGTSIHAFRNLLQPVWEEYGNVLRRGPMIAQQSAFKRHIRLFPMFAHHLARDGEQLFGPPDFLADLPPLDIHDAYGRIAFQAIDASMALAPGLLDSETAAAKTANLHSLARQLRGNPIASGETTPQLTAHIHHILQPRISQLPIVQTWDLRQMPSHTSPLMPGLQAIYREADTMVLVFAHLTPQQILRINWTALGEKLADQCSGLKITTAAQLCLAYGYERPLDLKFMRLQHTWGQDFLGALQVDNTRIIRQSARMPSTYQIDILPSTYLTSTEDDIHKVIHDFQNRLLNVQLEHELLMRFGISQAYSPPEPLPGRDALPAKRIDAIFQHFGWWSDHYNQMLAQLANASKP